MKAEAKIEVNIDNLPLNEITGKCEDYTIKKMK
jgi:hypothetical protein